MEMTNWEIINGPETYRKMAAALPWEIQSALLALRDNQEDSAVIEEIYYNMPAVVYFALQELTLATEWNETKRDGLHLTKLGNHLVDHCSC